MAGAEAPPKPASERRLRRRRMSRLRYRVRRLGRVLFLALGPLVVVTAGGVWYATSGRIVSTENAYVQAEHILVTPAVDGMVAEVFVRDNQEVERGQPLFQVDPMPFRLEWEKAEAELDAIRYEIGSYRAAHRQAEAELKSARKEASFLEKEYERRAKLGGGKALAKVELDKFRHEWQLARQRIPELEEKVRLVLANLGGKRDLAAEDHPRFRLVDAERAKAALDLERATVRAAASGRIANLDLQAGEYVKEGSPVFSLIADVAPWIEANLKETQLTHVREGQSVTISVDAYPDERWQGTVSGVSAGTGAVFSLLPAQNATGNWVKVVQRIPVRVAIFPRPDAPELRAGMSATVEIDSGHERALPGVVSSALALVGYRR
jgi:membrane fusion protein (multidrug efflux system)